MDRLAAFVYPETSLKEFEDAAMEKEVRYLNFSAVQIHQLSFSIATEIYTLLYRSY